MSLSITFVLEQELKLFACFLVLILCLVINELIEIGVIGIIPEELKVIIKHCSANR